MAGAWCIDTTCNHMGWGALDKGVGKHCTVKMRTPRGLGGYLGCFLGLGKIINICWLIIHGQSACRKVLYMYKRVWVLEHTFVNSMQGLAVTSRREGLLRAD